MIFHGLFEQMLMLKFLQEGKKKFDKETTKFCMSLERHLNLSTKKSENSLQEVSESVLCLNQSLFSGGRVYPCFYGPLISACMLSM